MSSSSLVNKITTKVRDDHTQWQCKTCGATNSMDDRRCSGCGNLRVNNSRAISSNAHILGDHAGKNDRGEELWHYRLQTNGTH